MNSRTQAFVLLLFGAALLRLGRGDALLRYVRPVARPWVLLAGAGMVLLAVWSLIAAARRAHATVDAHGHGAATRSAWLVLAPVVAILVIAPPALGTFTASRAPATVGKPADTAFPALPGGNPVPVRLIDFATRALWDQGRTLTGRQVALTGFVLRGADGSFILSRLVITCCAADARPIDIGVRFTGALPAAGAWVTVAGSYAGTSSSDATLPILAATAVTPVREPANPYDD